MQQAPSDGQSARRVPGRPWVKGQSGNPKGRAGERKFDGKTLAELARCLTGEALETVRAVMLNPEVPVGYRLQAAEIVLRRGWGDAPRQPEVAEHEYTFRIVTYAVDGGPVAGVLCSPVESHVSLPSVEPIEEVPQ